MNQRPLIYVHRITNLSDARYCAGMGVDILGFVVDPTDPDYVTPKLYQDMVGWVAGPMRTIEWRSASSPDWDDLLEAYKPDLLHIPISQLGTQTPSIPLIVEIQSSEFSLVAVALQTHTNIHYLLVSDGLKLTAVPHDVNIPVLLEISGEVSTQELIQRTGASGLGLQGTTEVAPGLKDYDHLALILEGLDG